MDIPNRSILAKAEQSEIPLGPSTLPGLFDWADYNASKLLDTAEYAKSFQTLTASCDIEIYDFFSGTGNGSSSLKQQFAAFADKTGLPHNFKTNDINVYFGAHTHIFY